VVPVSSGGGNTWDNLVTACMACNQRKGSKSLKSLGWRLRNVPKEPSAWELGTVGLAVGHVSMLVFHGRGWCACVGV
jgi:5-methylcytosine-specific restriction endonuclease McrA